MDLSSEDNLRLNVLLANKLQAIRIDESAMVVYGLSEKGDAKVPLNPTCRDEQYLKTVRELLSGHATGSPGGYPVFLKRWTRMGQMRKESIEQLLLLGEPEAVMAAVCTPGISDELARRAWWSMQDAENARRMLQSPAVVQGGMGPVLAQFLIEFLPFETESEKIIESVRLVLQPGLLDDSGRKALWKKSSRKQAYLVGFMKASPDALPEEEKAHPDWDRLQAALLPLAGQGNELARQMLRCASAPGQAFLRTLRNVLKKPPNQDVVTAVLDSVGDYFRPLRPGGDPDRTLQDLQRDAEHLVTDQITQQTRECIAAFPDALAAIRSIWVLSGLGYGVVRPVFSKTTAIGSLMRRRLEPVLQPLVDEITVLLPNAD